MDVRIKCCLISKIYIKKLKLETYLPIGSYKLPLVHFSFLFIGHENILALVDVVEGVFIQQHLINNVKQKQTQLFSIGFQIYPVHYR